MTILYEPEIPTAGHYEITASVQSEVCICNKVSVSADRLSTHTNFKKNCHL
jgi:flagellar assembly factor FliW